MLFNKNIGENLLNKKICSAIESKRIITFMYDRGLRKVEPYCYGVSAKVKEFLRAFQISGYSSSGISKGWKLFSVAKISNLKVLDEVFQKIRSEYNPNDSVMTRIFCRV